MTLATSGALLRHGARRGLLLHQKSTSRQALACPPCLTSARIFPVVRTRSFHKDIDVGEVSHPIVRLKRSLRPSSTEFTRRHIGPSADSTKQMLAALDPPVKALDEFVQQVLPADVLLEKPLILKASSTESDMLATIDGWTHSDNRHQKIKNYIGCGYYAATVPEVIKRNVLENPGWYTSYTPYQAEISQGRLESLLNFQTMVSDLTGLDIANASVLDEPTAAAEAMTMTLNSVSRVKQNSPTKTFVVSHLCHPQTLAVLRSRAEGFGINIVVGDVLANGSSLVKDIGDDLIGVLAQYPDTEGGVYNFSSLADTVHQYGGIFSTATDLLACTILKPPGEFGADIAFGNAQRFGVPLGNGGPHAAFFACTEKLKRKIPGRLVGISKDRLGQKAMRLALQTREQHIRREKATSNICTAQALLANMSAFYAIYHGPSGLKEIAERVVRLTRVLEEGLRRRGYETSSRGLGDDGRVLFDTVVVKIPEIPFPVIPNKKVDIKKEKGDPGLLSLTKIKQLATQNALNFRYFPGPDNKIGISLDETTSPSDVATILTSCFPPKVGSGDGQWEKKSKEASDNESITALTDGIEKIEKIKYERMLEESLKPSNEFLSRAPTPLRRETSYLTHPVFNSYHSETELMRYIWHLQSKDISLVHSMIPLGSCTMKLNAAAEMRTISNSHFANKHPFAPESQKAPFNKMKKELRNQLASITGFDDVTLQPNSGAQGEFTGLRVIRKYQEQQPGKKRDICLIPVSAHGTNPASAAMAGMRVVSIKCDHITGNLDIEDLKAKCEKHKEELGAIMVTYPSTFGVFEPEIKQICNIVHEHGGQVYMDGANMNAQIGLCSPGDIGADVCHLNLHKTFCIPHGGGGPGVGPICVKKHLAPFLPGHPEISETTETAIYPVSGAPYGSASILPISWAYIKMMGGRGLTQASKIAILNANYILARLKPHFPIVYTNANGRCAHEFILDIRPFHDTAGIEAIDVAKRLQDYGFHAPTMSWPVANTLMIEPTESESKEELDRFCDALISIRKEIEKVENGEWPREENILKMAPHPQQDLLTEKWDRSYSREQAAYPLPWLREKKFWPSVARVDDTYGDTHLFCTCPPVEEMAEQED
ncbi:MAG: glycine decarboxylase subunit P [Cirrosporium novae-zelandiae]|nr:MAG: glycine decarboxylase subunit P [Cirrosporium novae-zelandiae]